MGSASRLSVLVLAGMALGLAGCGPSVDGPNILIAVFDACRPDKLGCYGFERPTSPTVDALAADPDSVVYERYYVQGSWTKPSTASLFTGLFMHQHHVSGGSKEGEKHQWFSVLPDELVTLAERFQDAGYNTFSVTGNPHLDPRFGFDQGFDSYQMMRPMDYGLQREVLLRIEEADRPFLGYVHFTACHYPYAEATRDVEYMTEYGFEYDESARIAEGIDFTQPAIRELINDEGLELEPDDIRFLNLIFEARMRGLDRRVIAPFFEGLRELDAWDDTLLVFTADHGEELFDHGGYGHGHALWEEVVQVPLIIKFPKGRRPESLGDRWSGLTRSVDLFPSLARFAGLERPAGSYGRNIFAGAEIDFSLSDGLNRNDDFAWVSGSEKLISRPGRTFMLPWSAHRIRIRNQALFDLAEDPGETHDLTAERPESVRAAVEAIKEFWRTSARPRRTFDDVETEPLTDEQVETLRSLGYLD